MYLATGKTGTHKGVTSMEKNGKIQQNNMSEEELDQISGGFIEGVNGAGYFGTGTSSSVNNEVLENVTLPENLYT